MINRLSKPLTSNSFFLFGGRGTGKSTFLKSYFADTKILWIDLLQPKIEDTFSKHPEALNEQVLLKRSAYDWVVIDEVQKVPRLLDVVHSLIESTPLRFALTGSSARKLKRGSANLLAGRAFVNYMFPFTHIELGESFCLADVLRWGTLPKLVHCTTEEEKIGFLESYSLTYLKEEIWAEHIIRNLDPFRRFLEIAAQTNGEVINFTKIARDVGVDHKTVQSYFQILEDTLVGFLLPAYHRSVRKQQRQAPKFFLFDTGVKRALEGTLTQVLLPQTYGFGKAFEHWILLECQRLNHYFHKFYRFFYLLTKDHVEIDLIIEKPDQTTILVEIKSSENITEYDLRALFQFAKEFNHSECVCLSRDPHPKKIGVVTCLPWQQGLRELFEIT